MQISFISLLRSISSSPRKCISCTGQSTSCVATPLSIVYMQYIYIIYMVYFCAQVPVNLHPSTWMSYRRASCRLMSRRRWPLNVWHVHWCEETILKSGGQEGPALTHRGERERPRRGPLDVCLVDSSTRGSIRCDCKGPPAHRAPVCLTGLPINDGLAPRLPCVNYRSVVTV